MRTVLPPKAALIPANARLAFKGVIYSTYQWQQKTFDGTVRTFEMLRRPDTVQVIAVKDESVVMLNECQPGDSGPYHSIPGGRHDRNDETELDAARRELREETGMTFSDWRLIDVHQPHAKIEHFVYVFLASRFEQVSPPTFDGGECIRAELVDLSTLKEAALQPDARGFPLRVLQRVNDIESLLDLPEYRP